MLTVAAQSGMRSDSPDPKFAITPLLRKLAIALMTAKEKTPVSREKNAAATARAISNIGMALLYPAFGAEARVTTRKRSLRGARLLFRAEAR